MQSFSDIPSAYQSLCRAFDEREFLLLLRQWFKRPPQLGERIYEMPAQYQRHVQRCRRIAQYTDVDDEIYDVVVVQVAHVHTWLYKQRLLHGVAVSGLRGLVDAPDFRAIVAYVSPGGEQWRMQYIEQEIESYRDAPTAVFKTRQRVTSARQYLLDFSESGRVRVPFAYWDMVTSRAQRISCREIKEAYMTTPATSAEAFQRAYEQGVRVLDEYVHELQQTYKQVGFSERAAIDKQMMQLNQYAAEWERSAKALQQFLTTTHAPQQPQPTGTGIPLSLMDDWTHQTIVRFQHQNRTYVAQNWTQLYESIIELMAQQHGDVFFDHVNQHLQKNHTKIMFARDPQQFRIARLVHGWYMDVHGNANVLRDKIKKIYHIYGIPWSEMIVWVNEI